MDRFNCLPLDIRQKIWKYYFSFILDDYFSKKKQTDRYIVLSNGTHVLWKLESPCNITTFDIEYIINQYRRNEKIILL